MGPIARWVRIAVVVVVLVPTLSGTLPISAHSTASARTGTATGSILPPTGAGPLPSERVVAPAFVRSPGVQLLGAAPPGARLEVAIGLWPSDADGLSARAAAAALSGSPPGPADLSPLQVAQRYGPSSSEVSAVERYFSGFGLSSYDPSGGFLLLVAGPTPAVGKAFGTTLDQYRDPSGRLFLSHSTPATVPSSLGITGVYGLGNAEPARPFARAAVVGSSGVVPLASCGPGPTGALSPCQVQTAYGSSAVLSGGTNGSGERIAIVDAYAGVEPETALKYDFSTFTARFALPSGGVRYAYPVPTPRTNLNNSSLNPDWGLEEALDLEWARASAPGASLVMTLSPDPGPGLLYAVNWLVATHAADVISLSWGEPLTGIFNAAVQPCGYACNATADGSYAILGPVFEAAAAEGISVFAATGDCGAADGTSGYAVNYPAADPFVTAVGGTFLRVAPNGTYLGETGWNGSASGSTAPGCTNQGGSGGGFSDLPRPAWQAGLPNASGGRALPDVSLDGATPATLVYEGGTLGAFGTSLSTPIWAGIAAMADQRAGHALGFLNPSLYAIYRSANYSVDFHDIVSGNNGYPAVVGWDPVTGIGSPLVGRLLPDLAAYPAGRNGGPTTVLFATPQFGPAPLNVGFNVSVTGGSGTYAIVGVNFGDGNSSLAGRADTHSYRYPGVYSATAFAVDSRGNASVSPPIAIVVGGGGTFSVVLEASNSSPATGSAIAFRWSAYGGTAPYLVDLSFGDGTFAQNLTTTSVDHTYGAPGAYCAEAVAWDSSDPPAGAASARVGVAVGGASAPVCTNVSSPLAVTGGPTVTNGSAPLTVDFTSNASGGYGPPYAYHWRFDTGAVSVGANASIVFAAVGNHTATLVVTDRGGQSVAESWNVSVTGSGSPSTAVPPALVGTAIALVAVGVGLGVFGMRRKRTARPPEGPGPDREAGSRTIP